MAMSTKIRKRAPSPSSFSGAVGRIELFFKNQSELKERVRFLRSSGVSSFNLVNKDKKDNFDVWIDSIRDVYPEADICAHYSLKHNKVPRKGIEQHKELLLKSFECSNEDEILLISGSGEKKAWNTVTALRALQKIMDHHESHPRVAVAYNPYFPSDSDQEQEDHRLLQKLATGCVTKIYLQFGTDMERLQKGLNFIKNNKKHNVEVAGSLFLPTKKLIAQQKFRPWNGVFLSTTFLNGPEEATAIVSEMIRVYKENKVELLWEAPGIRTEKDMSILRELLHAARVIQSSDGYEEDDFIDTNVVTPKRVCSS